MYLSPILYSSPREIAPRYIPTHSVWEVSTSHHLITQAKKTIGKLTPWDLVEKNNNNLEAFCILFPKCQPDHRCGMWIIRKQKCQLCSIEMKVSFLLVFLFRGTLRKYSPPVGNFINTSPRGAAWYNQLEQNQLLLHPEDYNRGRGRLTCPLAPVLLAFNLTD